MRQVSFTRLRTWSLDSNPAQYERNHRFGHLVHVRVQLNGGAKLPSVGFCLNASKVEARLDMKTLVLGLLFVWGRIGFSLHPGLRNFGKCLKCTCVSWTSISQSGGPKLSIDDLCTGRGVILRRAATTLRSIETQPFDWMICSCHLDKSSENKADLFSFL